MKNILLVVCLIISNASFAQRDNAIYLTTTSIPESNNSTIGVMRFNDDERNNLLSDGGSITFLAFNPINKVELWFSFSDYNLNHLSQQRPLVDSDTMENIVKPRSFLDSITTVNLDNIIANWSREEVFRFFNSIRDQNVYIIDSNDFTNDTILLIDTRKKSSNEPKEIIIEEE